MKRIRIGQADRDLDGADPNWIQQHVDDLRRRRVGVCVEITLRSGSVNMILATPGCGPTSADRSEPNRQEAKVLELWRKKRLNRDDFDVRDLIDFVERVDII
jgi:hypothetical protein